MQNINTSYTVYINRKYKRSGHLFQGRFKGIIVDKNEYLITLSRYIHLNPVRAQLVKKPVEYRWTSYMAYTERLPMSFLIDTSDTLCCFSNHLGKAKEAYMDFVEAAIGGEENPFEDVKEGLILGTKRFKENIKKLIDNKELDEEIPQIKKLKETISIEQVILACSDFYHKKPEDLLRRSRLNRERQIAIYMSKVLSGKKNGEVGSFFGIKGPAVSGIIKIIERRLEKEKTFKKELERLKENVLNEN